MRERITIHKSKRKAIFIILGALFLLGISFVCFAYANDAAFGWMFLFSSLLIFILGMSRLWDRKPEILLTANGITELHSIREEIEWDAIIRADDFFFRGQYFVRLLIPAVYKPEVIRPGWFWRLDRLYARQELKAMYIRVSGLEINAQQLVTLIDNMIKSDPVQRENYLLSVREKW